MKLGFLWKVEVYDTSDETEKTFLIDALEYKRERLIEILSEVHPEYNIIKLYKVE